MKNKTKYLYIFLGGLLLLGACKKSTLDQVNPNQPNPDISLKTEAGLTAYAAGILQRTIYPVPNEGNSNLMAIVMTNHSIMGDEVFLPYGNFSFRWTNQVYQVTLPGGTVVQNPFQVTQQVSLQGFNSRSSGDLNAFIYEWTLSYFFISQANTLLASLNTPPASLSESKVAAYKAWAYWWKGYSYSRVGSMYLSGIINNDATGATNGTFVDHNAIITEANKNFDSCNTILQSLPAAGDDDYGTVMGAIVLDFNKTGAKGYPTPAEWMRQLNSYKARNLLVNKKVADMTPADWQSVKDLATNGLKLGDTYFSFGMEPDGANDLTNGFLHPMALLGPAVQWTFLSERLVQEFKAGDARFTRDVEELPVNPNKDDYYNISAFTNIRSRGLQFGTHYAAVPIENGGDWATAANLGTVPIGCSPEENELMLAEADIYLGNIDDGLTHVDAVRASENAGLPAVSGTGLSLANAKEELRKERRIGLFEKGVSFYDARRWGVTAPASAGGGRADAIVYVPHTLINTVNDQAVPCFMEYNYMDYWDIPQNELDFNAPATGSAAIKN
ncbi:MAG TPA: RagB/SusD family nutrient uptake outer membrane protein [Puia sp.]|nr:RagB/SusD family nutrient uptake outer membrane protein [Puia sp.]